MSDGVAADACPKRIVALQFTKHVQNIRAFLMNDRSIAGAGVIGWIG